MAGLLRLDRCEFGIDPAQIVNIVRRHWLVSHHLPNAIEHARRFHGNDWLIAIAVNLMSNAWVSGYRETGAGISLQDSNPVGGVEFFKESDVKKFLAVMRRPGERACVFNLSARVRAVEQALQESVS